MSDDELTAEIARLKAENERLKAEVVTTMGELLAVKAEQAKDIYLKQSEKGGVSLYGIRRFPITFYMEEWERILGMAEEIRAFIRQHAAALKTKGTPA